ncbi:MAG: MipA/OmpV family protein [Pseudomonadota bacterium]|nr:MipA/OmpV family protein [Pseudomonadota bacterium]
MTTDQSAPNLPLAFGRWLTLVVMACGTAELATAEPGIDVEPSGGSSHATAVPERKSSRQWTVGAGAAVRPDFMGSDEYQGQPAPLIEIQLGRFFARSGEGIGLNAIETETFRAGVTVNWMQGYDAEDAPVGLNEVKDALGARVFASVRLKAAVATIAGTKAVTESERGLLINASLAYPIRVTKRLAIVPSVGAAWADDDYMVSYFGVDPSEAAVSAFDPYRPESGFRDVSFRLAASYLITDRITAVAFAGVTHLLGDAADSPFVERQTQPLGLVGLTYTF